MHTRERLQLVRQVAFTVREDGFRNFFEVSGNLCLCRFDLLRILQEELSDVIGCKPLLFLFGCAEGHEWYNDVEMDLRVSRYFCGDSTDGNFRANSGPTLVPVTAASCFSDPSPYSIVTRTIRSALS